MGRRIPTYPVWYLVVVGESMDGATLYVADEARHATTLTAVRAWARRYPTHVAADAESTLRRGEGHPDARPVAVY